MQLSRLRDEIVWRAKNWAFSQFHLQSDLPSGLHVPVASHGEWIIFQDIFVGAEYDDAIAAGLASVHRGETLTVLDLGANVGFFTFRLASAALLAHPSRGFRVVAVEASPFTHAELVRRLEAEPKLRDRVTAVNGLAGTRSGQAVLYESAFRGMSSMTHVPFTRPVPVDYVDLERLLPKGPIHLLKCDIEGAEEATFATYPALLRRVRNLVVELHPELCDVPHCRALLTEAGLKQIQVQRETKSFTVERWQRD